MADDKVDIQNRITNAQETLGSVFSVEDLGELQQDYMSTIKIDTMSKEFSQISNSIRKMRSSYLPIEFFLKEDSFDEEIADMQSESESYENTFLRMLGMPLDIHFQEQEDLLTMMPDGETKSVSYEVMVTNVLNERQKNRSSRSIKIENSALFGIWTNEPTVSTPVPATIANDVSLDDSILMTDNESIRIDDIDQNIFKFSYLLVPPIQDSRVSGCINESNKIVLPPFSFVGSKSINSSIIKPTLLESVIRIRLDKLSGTNTFHGDEFSDSNSELLFSEIVDSEPNIESYGLLESLFIIRLDAALGGLAIKMIKDIDDLMETQQLTGLTPSKTPEIELDDGNNNSESQIRVEQIAATSTQAAVTATESFQAANIAADIAAESVQAANIAADFAAANIGGSGIITEYNEEATLKRLKLIEDSILSLLGDNNEVLDLQVQTQRNSSIHTSHMMSGLVAVINLPRSRVEERLSEIDKAKLQTSRAIMDPILRDLNTSLGTDIGIGVIDIVVFSLALFTISEESLVGLLAPEQFEKLKNGNFKNLLPGTKEQKDMGESINELTELIVQGYHRFRKTLITGAFE